jgi:hypothetical protein
MKRFLQLLELAVKLLPMIVAAVKAIEDAVPVAGQGPSKAELLKAMIDAAYEAGGEDLPPLASVFGLVDKLTGGVVALFKRAGIFKAA